MLNSITAKSPISTRGLEVQNSASAILVGLYLLHPAETFGSAAGYAMFRESGFSELIWGSVFLVIGTLQLCAVLQDNVIGRRVMAVSLAVLFGIYVVGFALANPLSLAIPFVLPMVLGQVWAYYQARRVV